MKELLEDSVPRVNEAGREARLVSLREAGTSGPDARDLTSMRLEQIVSSLIDPKYSTHQLLDRDEMTLQLRIDTSQLKRLQEATRHIDADRVSELREATLAALDPLAFLTDLLSIRVVGVSYDPVRDSYAIETHEGDLFWVGSLRQILRRGHLASILAERHEVLPTIDKDSQLKLLMLALQWAKRTSSLGDSIDFSVFYVDHLFLTLSRSGQFTHWAPQSASDTIKHPIFLQEDEEAVHIHLPSFMEWIRTQLNHEPRIRPLTSELTSRGFEQCVMSRRLADGVFQIRTWKIHSDAPGLIPNHDLNVPKLLDRSTKGGYPR